jgi:MFS family permease
VRVGAVSADPGSARPRPFATILARPWLLAFLPVNAATAAFGLSLQLLLILKGHDALLTWALASTLFNCAIIVSSVLWGYLSDRYPLRRRFLLVNYVGFALAYLALDLLTSRTALLVLYTAVGVLTPAGVSASNLLILERFSEGERAVAYGSFQEISILGSIVGGVIGFFWLESGLVLRPILFLLAGLALASAAIVWFGVQDPPRPAKVIEVAQDAVGLASRIRHSVSIRVVVPFFPRRPMFRRESWRRLLWRFRQGRYHELPLIFAAMLLFNLSANLFNISYTFYLSSIGVAFSAIFLVNVSNNVAQGVLFPFTGTLSNRSGADRVVRLASLVRGFGYLAVGLFTFVPSLLGRAAFAGNAAVYALVGGAIAFYSTASSLILFRALRNRDAGSLLGINSALGGVAAVVGAFLSGLLSVYGSYRLTFLVATVTLLASLPLWVGSDLAFAKRRFGPAIPSNLRSSRDAVSSAATRSD